MLHPIKKRAIECGFEACHTRSFADLGGVWAVDGGYTFFALERFAELHDGLFNRLDEINPERGRPWRDVHDVWQWGLTDAVLEGTLERLGFGLAHYEDAGPWQGLARFRNRSFVFVRERDG